MYNPIRFVLTIYQQFSYMINGSHVQRLLVHVHMYTMYFLLVVLVLGKDVIRLCSYRVRSEGSYIDFLLQNVNLYTKKLRLSLLTTFTKSRDKWGRT